MIHQFRNVGRICASMRNVKAILTMPVVFPAFPSERYVSGPHRTLCFTHDNLLCNGISFIILLLVIISYMALISSTAVDDVSRSVHRAGCCN